MCKNLETPQVAMLCAVLIPGSSPRRGLDGLHIGWWGWLFSLGQGKFLGGSLPNQAVID